MTTLTLYKLQPRQGSGFHFGELGLELEESHLTFPSDSLFAAMIATMAEQEGQAAVQQFMEPFEKNTPSFRLTSVFPYVGDLPLLPLPRLPIHTGAASAAEHESLLPRKFAKKVRFVSPEICRRLCAAESMAAFLSDTGGNGRFLQHGAIWLTADEQALLPAKWQQLEAEWLTQQRVWHQGHVTRVSVDRVSSSSNVYLMGRVTLNKACGLWVGVDYAETAVQKTVESLLEHLGDRGIGGERNSGYGIFTLHTETEHNLKLPSNWPQGNGYALLLSRYLPQESELPALQAEQASYRLETVSGWLTSPNHRRLRRKQITMLTEGSVVGEGIQGRYADVQPDWENFSHPVYRFGYAVSLPVTAVAREPA